MLTINNRWEVEIQIEESAVDSFITHGYDLQTGDDLTDEQLDWLNNKFTAEVQEYAYANGSKYHN